MSDSAIITEHLGKHFRKHVAVDDLSIEVRRGEIFGFLGPNGAGKTTTICMLLGLIRPTYGRAFVLGHDVQQQPVLALRNVGAMIETPAFYPYLSGRDNLCVLARAGGLPLQNVDTALAVVDLSARARDTFKTYSQGMRQRLGIAAALLNTPHLVILDEPTNGLDPAGQQEIRELIQTLAEGGCTIFLSSHMLHEIEQLCHRVAILRQGKLIAEGRVAELLQRGRGLIVRVADQLLRAVDLLRNVDWISNVEQHADVLLVNAPVERAPEITMLLAAQAIPVAEIRPYQERLEDFFLEITQSMDGGRVAPIG